MIAIADALERLKCAAVVIADVLDAGERDPTWRETEELERAVLEYGRSVRTSREVKP